jgi:hypothetical protein
MSLPRGRYKRLSLIVATGVLLAQAFTPSRDVSAITQGQATCGTWSIVPTSGTFVDSGRLEGVAATSASNVWVIRTASEESDRVARWDGTRWSEEAHPQPGTLFNDFQAIAASPDGDAWIVGAYSSSRVTRPSMAETSTLTARLQGGRWKLVPSPNLPNRAQSYLVGVAPIGPDDVWAVGNAGGEDILMRWDGTQWGLVPGPGTAQGGYLFDVAGTAPNDVWALGVYTTDRSTQAARILHWDGTRWQQVPSPDVASNEYNLQGVTALSATDAWAVGTRRENGRLLTLIEHWDGRSWTVVPSPNVTEPENTLHRVVAAAPDDVWAVGRAGVGGDAQPLMLHWNGSAWNTVALPRVSARFAELVSIEVLPGSGEVWAVGASADENGREHALAMRYVPCVAGEGSQGSVIPGMPSTGAAGSRTPTVWSIVSIFYDFIGAISALLRH